MFRLHSLDVLVCVGAAEALRLRRTVVRCAALLPLHLRLHGATIPANATRSVPTSVCNRTGLVTRMPRGLNAEPCWRLTCLQNQHRGDAACWRIALAEEQNQTIACMAASRAWWRRAAGRHRLSRLAASPGNKGGRGRAWGVGAPRKRRNLRRHLFCAGIITAWARDAPFRRAGSRRRLHQLRHISTAHLAMADARLPCLRYAGTARLLLHCMLRASRAAERGRAALQAGELRELSRHHGAAFRSRRLSLSSCLPLRCRHRGGGGRRSGDGGRRPSGGGGGKKEKKRACAGRRRSGGGVESEKRSKRHGCRGGYYLPRALRCAALPRALSLASLSVCCCALGVKEGNGRKPGAGGRKGKAGRRQNSGVAAGCGGRGESEKRRQRPGSRLLPAALPDRAAPLLRARAAALQNRLRRFAKRANAARTRWRVVCALASLAVNGACRTTWLRKGGAKGMSLAGMATTFAAARATSGVLCSQAALAGRHGNR